MQEKNADQYRFTTGKLVIGILTIVLSLFITFQSCAAGLGNTMSGNGSLSGTAGFLLALCWLVGGIVGIAARKTKGGSITAGGFYLFGAIMGLTNSGTFGDLKIWGTLSLVFGIIFMLSVILKRKNA